MAESVTLVCRVDSLNDKKYLDAQVSSVFKPFKKHFKGRRSDLTLGSEIERKYVFHELSADDAKKLVVIAKENQSKLCMKSVSSGSGAPILRTPPSSPPPVVSSPTTSPKSLSVSSISSDTKSLVLNFGVDSSDPSPSSTKTGTSFFSSESESDGPGIGTAIATPEMLLLRELSDIMNMKSKKLTPSQIGKAVSSWFSSEHVQKVVTRI